MTFWIPGTEILWCYGDPGSDFVTPMRVVRDDAEALVAWLPMGTPVRKLVRDDGQELRAVMAERFTAPRRQVLGTWTGSSVLRIYRPGEGWSSWAFFDGASGQFEGWYLNVEEAHRRGPRETRSRDQVVDLWVEPTGEIVRKDVDELELAVAQGRYTQQQADELMITLAAAERAVLAGGSPFDQGWETFVPDPCWPLPALA